VLRHDVVKRVLMILLSVATVAILIITIQEWGSGNRIRIFLVYWPALFLILFITYVKAIPSLIRSIVLVMLFFSVGLSELISFGLASLTYMFFVVGVSLSGVLFSRKVGYLAMAASLIVIGITAFLYVSGRIPIINNQQPVSVALMAWISSTAAYIVTCASLMETVTILIKELGKYSLKIKTLNRALEAQIIQKNREIAQAVEKSSRNSTLASVQTMFPKLFHQLNTPIGNALTAVSYLKDNNSQDENGEKLLEITLQSLGQARIEIGKLRSLSDFMNSGSYVSTMDFCDFIRENRNIIGGETDAVIELVFEKDHFSTELEPLALIEVLNFLVQNSCDHGNSSDPSVLITFRADDGDGMEILITDDGPGIPREDRAHIFEPFHSRAGVGRMGLGLTIARSITESRLGGTLELIVDSPGSGAGFLIHLPLNHQTHLSPSSEAVSQEHGNTQGKNKDDENNPH